MKAISLFSGVGSFDLGFERAGIETVLQAERDPWCLKVLARHWSQTERVTDVRDVGFGKHPAVDADSCGAGSHDGRRCCATGIRPATDYLEGQQEHAETNIANAQPGRGDVDLVFGGFPCQDLSVAGKRAGLGGDRSGLWFEFHRVLSELRPRWAVIENVPGLLSSAGGRDFGIILDGLGELGYGVAWAVLDAQHFGVPQRRRRVFIVGCLGDERSAAAVLSVCESCGGNPETGRTQGERTPGAITVRTDQTGGNDHNLGFDIASTLDGANGQAVAYTISPSRGTGDGHGNAWNSNYIAAPLGSNATGGFRFDLDHDTYIRRLTPLECARLQGFPDWWYDGLGLADSHIYRQMGNAVCVPVAEWIGHRIVAIEKARIATGLGEGATC